MAYKDDEGVRCYGVIEALPRLFVLHVVTWEELYARVCLQDQSFMESRLQGRTNSSQISFRNTKQSNMTSPKQGSVGVGADSTNNTSDGTSNGNIHLQVSTFKQILLSEFNLPELVVYKVFKDFHRGKISAKELSTLRRSYEQVTTEYYRHQIRDFTYNVLNENIGECRESEISYEINKQKNGGNSTMLENEKCSIS